MPQYNRFFPVRPRGYHVYRDLADLFHTLQVSARRGRQLLKALDAHRAIGPPRHFLVDGLATGEFLRTYRQDLPETVAFTVPGQFVAHPDAQGFDAIQHVELGNT